MTIEHHKSLEQLSELGLSIRQWKDEDLDALCVLEEVNWPGWLVDGKEVLRERIKVFPQGQMVVVDQQERPIASISTNRVNWHNPPDITGLPKSWDWYAGKVEGTSFEDAFDPDGNAIGILVINIADEYKGMHLPGKLIEMLREQAESMGVEYIIGPFRPSRFGQYKLETGRRDFMEYCSNRREDGQLLDPWLRVVERNGGVLLCECQSAMQVELSLNDFEEIKEESWVKINGEWECGATGAWRVYQDRAIYTESNLWGVFYV